MGKDVTIYQGVTLGGLSFRRDAMGNAIRSGKRHPTIADGVVVYANATILGGNTVVGSASVVGASVFVTESLPARSVSKVNSRNYSLVDRVGETVRGTEQDGSYGDNETPGSSIHDPCPNGAPLRQS